MQNFVETIQEAEIRRLGVSQPWDVSGPGPVGTFAAGGGRMPGAWSVTVTGHDGNYTAAFEFCLIKRDSFTINVGSPFYPYGMDYTMPAAAAGTLLYVGFQYNQDTSETVIISGSTLGEVSEGSLPENRALVKEPLCVMEFSGSGWREIRNLRNIPGVGLGN